jgi:hypothetical protein
MDAQTPKPRPAFWPYFKSVALAYVAGFGLGETDDFCNHLIQAIAKCELNFLRAVELGLLNIFHIGVVPVWFLLVVAMPFAPKLADDNKRILELSLYVLFPWLILSVVALFVLAVLLLLIHPIWLVMVCVSLGLGLIVAAVLFWLLNGKQPILAAINKESKLPADESKPHRATLLIPRSVWLALICIVTGLTAASLTDHLAMLKACQGY